MKSIIKTNIELDTLKVSQAALEFYLENLDSNDWYNRKIISNAIGDIKRSLEYKKKGLLVMKKNIETKLVEEIKSLINLGENRLDSCKKLAEKYKEFKVTKEEIEILWSDVRVMLEKESPEYKKELARSEKMKNTRYINKIKSKLKLVQATFEGEKGTYDISGGKVLINGNTFETVEDVENYKSAVIAEVMEGINELLDVMKLAKEIV